MSSSIQVGSSKRKRKSSKHVDPNILAVRRKIQMCCSKNDVVTAMDTMHCALRDGIQIEAQTFYNLLNLCDGFAEKGLHIGTPKPNDLNQRSDDDDSSATRFIESIHADETDLATQSKQKIEISIQQRKEYAYKVKGYMDTLNLPLIETAYTALIKILCRTGDLGDAESLLAESEKCEQCKPRLRLYSPLMVAYAEKGEKKWSMRQVFLSLCPFQQSIPLPITR